MLPGYLVNVSGLPLLLGLPIIGKNPFLIAYIQVGWAFMKPDLW